MRDLMNLVEQFSTENRKQVIVEGLREYLQMFNISPEVMGTAKKHVKDIMAGLQRADRVVWFLRYYRLSVVGYWVKKGLQLTDQQKDKLAASIGSAHFEEAVRQGEDVYRNFEVYKHFVGMKNAAIDRVVWDRQSPDDLLGQLRAIEDKWRENLKHSIDHDNQNYSMILDLGNGWAWFNLNTDYCKREADAMGHCGNGAGKSSDTILSLRKKVQDNLWSPRATFILDKYTGLLGEMKGRFNEKPDEKYHPFIVQLLKHDIIKGVKGGGYAPENNFSLNDLDPDEARDLKAAKPALRMAEDMWDDWKVMIKDGEVDPDFKATFEEKIEQALERYNFKHEEIVLDEANAYGSKIIIDSFPSSFFFRNYDPTDRAMSLLDDSDGIEDLITQHAPNLDYKVAVSIAEQVSQTYYENVLNALLQVYAREYEVMGTQLAWDKPNDKIVEYIGLDDFFYEEESVLDSAEELNTLRDYFDSDDYSSILDDISDELEVDLVKYCLGLEKNSNTKKDAIDSRTLVAEILKRYTDEKGNLTSDSAGAKTSSDPNQLDFGF